MDRGSGSNSNSNSGSGSGRGLNPVLEKRDVSFTKFVGKFLLVMLLLLNTRQTKVTLFHLGCGGIVVSILALNSDNLNSNPADC